MKGCIYMIINDLSRLELIIKIIEKKLKQSEVADIPGVGIFPNSESAYYALRNPYDKEYIDKLKNSKNPRVAKYIGEQYLETHGNIEDEKKIENIKLFPAYSR